MQEQQDAPRWTGADDNTWSPLGQHEGEQQGKDRNGSTPKGKKKPMLKSDKPPLPRGSAW
jgi:hypothetical protein